LWEWGGDGRLSNVHDRWVGMEKNRGWGGNLANFQYRVTLLTNIGPTRNKQNIKRQQQTKS